MYDVKDLLDTHRSSVNRMSKFHALFNRSRIWQSKTASRLFDLCLYLRPMDHIELVLDTHERSFNGVLHLYVFFDWSYSDS